MTEKEKAANGLLYHPYCDELREERERARDLCFQHNKLHPNRKDDRKRIIKQLFGKTGLKYSVGQPFYCDYGYNIEIGENLYINYNCVILDEAKVVFGNDVFVAPNCSFYTASHPLDANERNTKQETAHPIYIGNNVWIGGNVTVLPGITIGDNTVIGAGSVVVKDIPSNVVAAGNPCRVIKELKQHSSEITVENTFKSV